MRSVLVLLFLVTTSPLWAVVVRVKDRAEPLIGALIRDEKERIVVRTTDTSGKTQDETVRRTDIEELIPPFSGDRLAELDPAKPEMYRDYAEELRARRRDPESRDMAIRLYLIAAWLDRENLARSALLGLVSLARSTEEERKFRAALFLYDPRTPAESLQTREAPSDKGDDGSAASELLRAMRLLRTGKGSTARAVVEKPPVLKLLESYSRVMSKAEFAAAAGQATLNPRELRQVLVLELELEAIVHPEGSAKAATSLAWSRELSGDGNKAVPSLSLETLTEFDPRKCAWRDGKWQERK